MIHPMFWALSTLPSSPIILLSALSQMTVSHTLDFVMRNNCISNANMILSSCLLLCFNLLLLVLHFQQSSDPSRTNNPLILYFKSFPSHALSSLHTHILFSAQSLQSFLYIYLQLSYQSLFLLNYFGQSMIFIKSICLQIPCIHLCSPKWTDINNN